MLTKDQAAILDVLVQHLSNAAYDNGFTQSVSTNLVHQNAVGAFNAYMKTIISEQDKQH